MTKEDFRSKFKEELNIKYESASSKWDKNADQYQQGMADGIDIVEGIFDKLWRQYDKNE
jgi:hypothetical protein